MKQRVVTPFKAEKSGASASYDDPYGAFGINDLPANFTCPAWLDSSSSPLVYCHNIISFFCYFESGIGWGWGCDWADGVGMERRGLFWHVCFITYFVLVIH